MSRSYRKPYFTDQMNGRTKEVKRRATRKVRKVKDVSSGKAYTKYSESWEIRDYSFYSPDKPKARRK